MGKNSIITKCITKSCPIAGHADSQPKIAQKINIKESNDSKCNKTNDLRQIVTYGILGVWLGLLLILIV